MRCVRVEERHWKGRPERVIAPYSKVDMHASSILSTTGHEKPCGKLGGPPSKAKYSLVTDSEAVP